MCQIRSLNVVLQTISLVSYLSLGGVSEVLAQTTDPCPTGSPSGVFDALSPRNIPLQAGSTYALSEILCFRQPTLPGGTTLVYYGGLIGLNPNQLAANLNIEPGHVLQPGETAPAFVGWKVQNFAVFGTCAPKIENPAYNCNDVPWGSVTLTVPASYTSPSLGVFINNGAQWSEPCPPNPGGQQSTFCWTGAFSGGTTFSWNVVQTSTVSISATQPKSVEGGVAGTFAVTRTGSTASALTVFYQISGTADNGTDYATLPGTVTIPAGQSSATITVTAFADGVPEKDETVVLSLQSNAAYTIGTPSSATVTIAACKLPPLDQSFLQDPVAFFMEADAPTTSTFSIEVPYVELNLSIAADALIAKANPNAKIISGYRPLGYQAHFRNLRDTFVNYWTKLTDEERIACTDLYKAVNDEIDQKHTIRRFGSQSTLQWGTKIGAKVIGQPAVSKRSDHSGKNGQIPSFAVDIGGLSTIPNIDAIAKTVGLWRACGKDDPGHYQLLKTLCAPPVKGQLDPPFNLLIVDPLGRRLGIDPATNSFVNEIGVEASYTGFNTDFTQFFDIDEPVPGPYTIIAVNVKTGPYEMNIEQLSEDGDVLEDKFVSGVASSNQAFAPIVFFVPFQAEIDIKPGDFPNSINPSNRGKIPVAIISTNDFDAPALVDLASLSFGRTGDEKTGAFCHEEDVDLDGLADLVCHFNTQDTGLQTGDTLAILRGKTLDGTPIIGSDSVNIVP